MDAMCTKAMKGRKTDNRRRWRRDANSIREETESTTGLVLGDSALYQRWAADQGILNGTRQDSTLQFYTFFDITFGSGYLLIQRSLDTRVRKIWKAGSPRKFCRKVRMTSRKAIPAFTTIQLLPGWGITCEDRSHKVCQMNRSMKWQVHKSVIFLIFAL